MIYTIELASASDKEAIQGLLYPHYFNESIYKELTYDAEATGRMIDDWLNNSVTLLLKNNNNVVGFAVTSLFTSYYKEIECDVEMYFILKGHRGTGASRLLCEACINVAEANSAGAMYASCLSGIDEKNNNLFINLWKKYGFKTLGTVMIRGKNG